ncbi:hypothetical protein OXX69_007057 [Metschnikowia pulcherrima]
MAPERKKIALACIECRARKRRCQFDGGQRCVICERLDIECVTVSDGRKDRPQIRRIADLEQKLAHYKKVASGLRQTLDQAANALKSIEEDKYRPVYHSLDSPDEAACTQESLQPTAESSQAKQEPSLDAYLQARRESSLEAPALDAHPIYAPPRYFQAKAFQKAKHVSVSVYGPTSIFDTEALPRRELLEEHKPAALSKNPRIIECIKLFFRWQYPDMHAFIFREAFILDFFDPDSVGMYSSTELVYAICAMGASMSEQAEIRDSAHQFYTLSRDLLMATIDSPSICSLQAYLLLGLYDIYNYRNNAGWMLAGDALRMGFGIGFHLRPESWLVGDQKNVSEITISVRSRIFWGCFMADRFLSLILGRPSVIKPDSSTIHVSKNMPAIKWIRPYTYPGVDNDEKVAYIDISNPLGSIIKLAEISDTMMETVFSGNKMSSDKQDLDHKLDLVESYNRRLSRWREELPENLRWDRTLLQSKGHDTPKMFSRYYFYIIIMCLNRPFVGVPQKEPRTPFNSLSICMDAIFDVHSAIYSFVSAHGARRCSILIVYSSILSISILLAKNRGKFSTDEADLFFGFMTVLMHTSTTWKLSEKSFLKFRGTFKSDCGLDFETELQTHIKVRGPHGKNTIWHLLNRMEDGAPFATPEIDIPGLHQADVPDFSGFGDPWSSLFPDFFSAEPF